MLIAFCYEMGLSSVVFVGHDDGGLLALKAAQRLIATNDLIKVSILVIRCMVSRLLSFPYQS